MNGGGEFDFDKTRTQRHPQLYRQLERSVRKAFDKFTFL
jgi:hypothetical protein